MSNKAIKTVFIFLLLLLCGPYIWAQKEKLWRSETRQTFPNYDQVATFHDKKKRFATVKIISKSGIIRSETNFKDELKHGYEKVFYADGGLYWKSDYRNDLPNGAFMVYYPDGSLKRKEKYRNGFRKEGFCYDSLGNAIDYYPFRTEPIFGEGAYSLQRYFRDKWPASLKGNQLGWAILEMTLAIGTDSLARVVNFKIEDDQYRQTLLKAVQTMPKWKPGSFDGNLSESNYKISLILTSDGLYLAELMPRNNPSTINRNRNRF